jgi:phosphoglycolate phosphatase
VHSFVGKGMAVLVERCLTHDKPPTADALHAAIESFKRHYTEVNGRFTQIYRACSTACRRGKPAV